MSKCEACQSSNFWEKYPDELGTLKPSLNYEFTPHTRRTFRIVECENCSHQFCNPMPDLESEYEGTVDLAYLSTKEQRIKTARSSIKIVKKYLDHGSSLLDVGCNTGYFLDVASEKFDVQGIELSNWSADLAAINHLVHRVPLSALQVKSKYDGITLFGVIEHFHDPRLEIASAFQALKPGGVLFIYTGDRTAFLPRLLKKKWWWYQGMHLQYFSKSSLRKLLEQAGFNYVDSRRFPLFFSLNSLASSMNRYAVWKPISKVLGARLFKRIYIRIAISGEMLLIANKPAD